VQSLYIDSADFLWVLDAANPRFAGVVPDGPKLVRIDLNNNRVVQVIAIPEQIALAESYLNDVRVDLKTGTAYITDSGLGALIVTDLATGTSRRLLDGHPSVTDEGVVININGEAWRLPDGRIPEVHVDGLALTPGGDFLYYQALSGKNLYRIPTAILRSADLTADEVEKAVQLVGQTCVADGIEFATNGYLYLTDVENGAIRRLRRDGQLELVIKDPRLIWPDSLATGPDGALYVTTSQIHLQQKTEPYRLFRLLVRPLNP
jgi:sugar lactone lactonase YvrE